MDARKRAYGSCGLLIVCVPGAAQHLKGVYARLRGLWWCAADPGSFRPVVVPDQQCIASLALALHRIRDTLVYDREENDMRKDCTIGLVVPFASDTVPEEGLQMYPGV